MDEQEGIKVGRPLSMTQEGHNGIHNSLGFDSFREKIEQLLTEFPFEGAIFHSKGYGLKESERNSTIALVCNRLQWVSNGKDGFSEDWTDSEVDLLHWRKVHPDENGAYRESRVKIRIDLDEESQA